MGMGTHGDQTGDAGAYLYSWGMGGGGCCSSGGRVGRAKEERGCKEWGDWAWEGRGGMQALHRKELYIFGAGRSSAFLPRAT